MGSLHDRVGGDRKWVHFMAQSWRRPKMGSLQGRVGVSNFDELGFRVNAIDV